MEQQIENNRAAKPVSAPMTSFAGVVQTGEIKVKAATKAASATGTAAAANSSGRNGKKQRSRKRKYNLYNQQKGVSSGGPNENKHVRISPVTEQHDQAPPPATTDNNDNQHLDQSDLRSQSANSNHSNVTAPALSNKQYHRKQQMVSSSTNSQQSRSDLDQSGTNLNKSPSTITANTSYVAAIANHIDTDKTNPATTPKEKSSLSQPAIPEHKDHHHYHQHSRESQHFPHQTPLTTDRAADSDTDNKEHDNVKVETVDIEAKKTDREEEEPERGLYSCTAAPSQKLIDATDFFDRQTDDVTNDKTKQQSMKTIPIKEIGKAHPSDSFIDDPVVVIDAKDQLNLSSSGNNSGDIWNNFSLVGSTVDDCVIECNICQQKFKYNAQRVTTTMLNHLKSHQTPVKKPMEPTQSDKSSSLSLSTDNIKQPSHSNEKSPESLEMEDHSTIDTENDNNDEQHDQQQQPGDGNEPQNEKSYSMSSGPGSEESNIITVDSRPPEEVLPELATLPDPSSLPPTVTRLETREGAFVYLVGTSHFSKKSIEDVNRVMQSVKPAAVVLELCRERQIILQLDEEQLLTQCGNEFSLETLRQSIKKAGVVQGTIFVLFLKLSASLTKKLGMAPGGEFRAAAKQANELEDCRLYFGDRSLKITFARAVNSLTLWQKIKFVYIAMTSNISDLTQDELEKFKDKDMLEELLRELAADFPAFKKVLLDERNTYLAHSIYATANAQQVNKATVAVVGIGHVQGIAEIWGKTSDSDIKSLITVPEKSLAKKIIGKSLKYTVWSVLAYAGYRLVCPTELQNYVSDNVGNMLSKVARLRSS